MQEYDNEAEQAISDVAVHYTDTPLDIGMYSVVIVVRDHDVDAILHCVSKKVPTFKLSVPLSSLSRFSKFLHCWKAYKICDKTHMTSPTPP